MDLSKAYDSIDWYFLEDLLKAYYFPSHFIHWIMVCLKGVSYSLLLNGRLHGGFSGKKGLRQGDPISPLLFVLVMEYLTRLLIQAFHHKEFRFHPLCKRLALVNLCYTDDLILFCKGSLRSVQILQEGFTKFSQDSGLIANLSKSHIYFGGVHSDEKKIILDCVNIEEGSFPLKYLGLPLRPTKWKAEDCGLILKKIQSHLHSRSSQHLSFAGRSQLIHSVLLGIRLYWMSIFLLPQRVIHDVDRLCRNFLWGANGNRSKLHLSSWGQVCFPKHLGGIAFKEGAKWNTTLLAKYIWAISSKQDSLWVKWTAVVYLKGHDFWQYRPQADVSWYWRKLIKLRDTFSYDVLEDSVTKGKLNISRLYNHLMQKDKARFAMVLKQINKWLGFDVWPSTYSDWLLWMVGRPRDLHQRIVAAIPATAVYFIWINRNSCIFDHCSMTILKIDTLIIMSLKARLLRFVSQKLKASELQLVEFIQQL
ncbi:uncharacterized protein LOC133814956 [Humulus lupulus]|uniref:uncharacterized protein LOC133814956 n=1 Tax=Humulus lupulus TaxID=3486 RepID=UPI002B408025|nr:uncharacterized protein LOC133814956 [Humulus lupulus]